MKANTKLILIILLFATLTATALKGHASIPLGLWQSPCKAGLIREQLYEGHSVTLIERFHQDRNCDDLSFTFETFGEVLFTDPKLPYIDFTYRNIYLTLHKQIIIDDFNSRKVCGFLNWQLHHKTEITGLECALFNYTKKTKIPSDGDLKFGIYSLENTILYFGKLTSENDGSSALKRPTSINYNIQYFLK